MTPSDPRPAAVVVLAAGEGTRMRSATPKVLHALAGRTLLGHVLAAVAGLRPDAVLVVVGHERERVAEHLAAASPAGAEVSVVVQDEQLGTGHAVRVALEAHPGTSGTVLVVCGDTPLLRTESLSALLVEHAETGNAASVLTARVADPTGYGRVLRDSDGAVAAIVEHRDADDRQRAVDEVNSGIYAFQADALADALGRLTRDNSQGEEYLTDVVALLVGDGRRVGAVTVADPDEVLGVNDRAQLAEVGRLLRDRLVRGWMLAGVTVVDPTTCWVDVGVVLEPDAVVLPGAILRGATRIGRGAQVGPNVTLTDTVVAEGATVADATCVGAEVGPGASVGPYTYLRPGTRLGPGSRAGGFVEMKNAVVGEGSKVPHLSYVGDARIGTGSNIGAATVFVNYDGVAKHATVVGDDVRIGSDTMLVAPVTIGDGAYTAAGSVITDDVPPGAMGVGRARQRTIEGWVERKRPGTASAAAAKRAAHAATTDQTGDDAAEGGRQG